MTAYVDADENPCLVGIDSSTISDAGAVSVVNSSLDSLHGTPGFACAYPFSGRPTADDDIGFGGFSRPPRLFGNMLDGSPVPDQSP